MAVMELCSHCGQEVPRENLTEFDGQLLCSTCLDEETSLCYECGRRIWSDDNEGAGDLIL